MGSFKSINRVAQTYYWPKIRADIVKYVRSCEVCQEQKPSQAGPTGLTGTRKVSRPWQMVCTDLLGPFPISAKRNRFLLVVTDMFTKFNLLFVLRTATAASIKRHIENDVFLMYGVPEFLVCDNGKQYISTSLRSMVAGYNCRLVLTPMYHPQSNPTERINRVLNTMTRSYVKDNQRSWDANLAKLGFALRTSVHEVTGHTPAYLNFGRELSLSGTALTVAGEKVDREVPNEVADRKPLLKHLQDL